MKDYRKVLEGFLYGSKKEENFLKGVLQSVISDGVRKLLVQRTGGDDFMEDLLSELRVRLLKTKDRWQKLEYINYRYLKTMLRNFVVDMINGTDVEVYSLQAEIFEDSAKPVTYQDILKDNRDHYAEPEGGAIFEILLKKIKEDDEPVLCYYFMRLFYGVEIELAGLSKDSLYKRWERLRRGKLKEVFDGVDEEELRVVVELFLSEVCQRKGYISIREEKK